MADDRRRGDARESLVNQARRASAGRAERPVTRGAGKAQGGAFGKPVHGEGRPQNKPFGAPVHGEGHPQGKPFGKPVHGEGRPQNKPFGKPVHGEGHPQGKSFDKPVHGEMRPQGKPFGAPVHGENRPQNRPFAKPMHGEGHPQTRPFANPMPSAPHPQNTPIARPAPRVADGTPSRRAAHRALGLVTREGAYAGLALDRVLSEARMSAADRALATEVFYGTLEHMTKIDLVLSQLMTHAPEKPVMDVLRISAYQLMYLTRVPASAVCDEAVGLTRALGFESATGMVNGVLRNLTRRQGELKLPTREDGLTRFMAVEYSMPEFVCARLAAQYGAGLAESILAWHAGRHIVVRPNTLRIGEGEFERQLTAAGLRYERSRVPGAYRVYGLGAVDKSAMYRQGLFSVQGESSLLCAQVLAPRPGMQVLDACAAPGGKAAALAELMQGAGRVYACDIHAHRVELIRALASRLGHDMIKVRLQDASHFNPDWERAMDAVLCDVPCSGLGVVSSKPDIRLNITEAELDELPRVQAAILENCARYVRPGGTLVYSTCTLLAAENQDVVRAFLAGNPEFALDDVRPRVPECFSAGVQDGMLTLMGCRDDVDGFFIARMVRR